MIKNTVKLSAKLNRNELAEVAGGTVKELEELVDACGAMATFQTHIPISNRADASYVKDYLRNKIGIDANISLGVAGTGLFSKHNTYKDIYTGRSMSHKEVLERIKYPLG